MEARREGECCKKTGFKGEIILPKNWKYIKKLLEKEFLCEKLKGHITYDLTDYKPAPWYQQHFIMKYDDEVLLNVEQPRLYSDKRYDHYDGTSLYDSHIIERVVKKFGIEDLRVNGKGIEQILRYTIDEVLDVKYHNMGVYGVSDIIELIGVYLHSDIDYCFRYCQDPFLRALGVLDRRCGKRRLEKFARYCHWSVPDWLRRIYIIRFEAEGIRYHEDYKKKKSDYK